MVDDDQECLELACIALTAAGFAVEGLSDPRLLFERLGAGTPDVVVLDRHMPGDSGDMLAAKLRAAFGPHRPPVLLWTADAGRGIEAGLLSGLVAEVIVKGLQGVDVLVQQAINHAGWDHVGPGLMYRRRDGRLLHGGRTSRPLTEREVDFVYQLAAAGAAGVGRTQAKLLLLEPGASESSNTLLNQVIARFKRKLPTTLRRILVTVRGKGLRLDL
ncbi:MAG: response regulator [Elusimicrobia bacterium]|nr:response regulator [Elusimicrobiota bacterium]